MALINFAASVKNDTYATEKLYNSDLSKGKGIKTDLEYVAHHWQETGFDLWEQVRMRGLHFFTLMVQRKSMILGAALAERLGDTGAASFYRAQVPPMEALIRSFWDGRVIKTTIKCEAWCDNLNAKLNNVDSAQHLGALYGGTEGFFSATSDEVLSTVETLQETMQQSYQINDADSKLYSGWSVGRYYPDRYTGTGADPNFKGNPWFLTTASMAEIYFRSAALVKRAGKLTVSDVTRAFYKRVGVDSSSSVDDAVNKLKAYGDGILHRLRFHIGCDGGVFHIGEQFDTTYGTQKGANDLTWSYGTIVSAMGARDEI